MLGKIIGVYLGRPIEGMAHHEIVKEFGEMDRYVHEERGVPLVVTDDDISGTFTFLRALEDYDFEPSLTPAQIGQTWLNYIVEQKTVLWWGGVGVSTEHTAFKRLKEGVKAPESGSIGRNGQVVAEQIGAQIFIDGWGLINPGDPERAADFAGRAASVSHDGEAVNGAQVVAALVAQAFVEADLDRLLDTAVALIPKDSTIARLIGDVRNWHDAGLDWLNGFRKIEERYGYDCYGGGCHMVPNHALIIHALLHGEGDFDRSLMIVNTCGWDTDCNSGNVGCILGVRNGLAGIGMKWREPVADRILLPTADGGRCITDAVQEAARIVRAGAALRGHSVPQSPRFGFSMPESTQGFQSSEAQIDNPEGKGLRIQFGRCPRTGLDIVTPTFIQPAEARMPGYGLMASPTLYAGHELKASVKADLRNTEPVRARLALHYYGEKDHTEVWLDPEEIWLDPGEQIALKRQIPVLDGPIFLVGINLMSKGGSPSTVHLESLTWEGAAQGSLTPAPEVPMSRRAWVEACNDWLGWGDPVRIVQNSGRGMVITGTREWDDFEVRVRVQSHLCEQFGVAARVQGLRRYYALLLGRSGVVRLVKVLDGERVLAEGQFSWGFDQPVDLAIEAMGERIKAWADGRLLFEVTDAERPLLSGGIALAVDGGTMSASSVEMLRR